ncbi:phytoene desaturase family protein [Pseudoneobacillus rhizosphaerae]|uniref:Ferredoxin--NADP reductase n=1 Tax=Pseudoneobacillus rhizosphaerae TaxID=2880968 RepID=A0A9C7G8C9_9BACI|nr:FAD-dependent oxidoreductase [Pseudoneobacillus rhizosphaerae]CAG9607631.1 Ferredoxin--NADP reductase [Pseudoneobacillus rhizosphaerae]
MTQKWDVVIIGGGLAGYVAANYLAKTNLSILILEKGAKVGGRARTDRIHQQYFNLGPHALYKKGKAKPILEEFGVQLMGKSPKQSVTLIDHEMKYVAPFSPLGLLSTNYLNWKERLDWMGILLKIQQMNLAELANLSFKNWVVQATPSLKVQSLLFILARLSTYCHGPEVLSAKLIMTHIKIALGGVLYLDYGWQSLIDQLHNQAVIKHVKVQTRTNVKEITQVDDGHFRLETSTSKNITARYVISTIGPHELNQILSESVTMTQRGFFTDINSVQGATLDVALTELPDAKQLFAMGISEPMYFSVHSHYARLSNHRNSVVLHVFKYYHNKEAIDGKKVQLELEQFLDKVQTGWQKFVITKRFIPQITVNQRFPLVGDEQKLVPRSKTTIPGLYIAGDWASPDYILSEAAISSGKAAAEAIISKEME